MTYRPLPLALAAATLVVSAGAWGALVEYAALPDWLAILGGAHVGLLAAAAYVLADDNFPPAPPKGSLCPC